jgi:hypothetical protein
MENTNQLITRVEQVNELMTLLPSISQMDDAALVKMAINALYLERFAFVLRGVCAAELRRRIPVRLAGGRGKQDREGLGIKAQTTRLAKEIGINLKTLDTDARISETFFKRGETMLVREDCLPREYYVVALGAPDPLAAIEIAQAKHAEPEYKLQQFRSYVRELKRDVPTNKASPEREALYLLRVNLPKVIHLALTEIIERSGQTKEVVVADAILSRHLALAGRVVKEPTTRARSPTANVAAQDDRQLRLDIG